jgi:hypothetical protein
MQIAKFIFHTILLMMFRFLSLNLLNNVWGLLQTTLFFTINWSFTGKN